jgi:predicted phosphodiesterase
MILGDLHFPYHNPKALKETLYAVKHEKPNYVVQIGDLLDQYSFSRFTRKNITLPERELSCARREAVDMWKQVKDKSSGVKAIQILGNHDLRLIKRAQERLPEAQELVTKSMMELYRFKGVHTIEDDRTVYKIGDISFHHGYLSKLGDHMRYQGRSIVVGHSHTGGVVFEQRNGKTLFELNAGYLADESAEPLRYRPTKTSKWTLGFGLITFRGKKPCPAFIPL